MAEISIRIDLIGFGQDRPPPFGDHDSLTLSMPDGADLTDALGRAGLDETPGLSVLLNERPVRRENRHRQKLHVDDVVIVMYAMEGGALCSNSNDVIP